MNVARGKAEQLAALAEAQLGEILTISEGFSQPIPLAGSAMTAAEQAVPIEPGMQTVTANIQVIWPLVPSDIIPSTGGTPAPTETASPTRTISSTRTAPPTGTATQAASPGASVTNFNELVKALRAADARVDLAGNIQQPFFPVEGQLIRVNGTDVRVFEFQDEASRQAVSETISETGEVIGTSIASWIAQPNFWAHGRIIVLFVGEDQELIDLLTGVLGEPITSPETSEGLPPVAAIAAQQTLAYRLGVSTDQVQILSPERVEWPDSCMGLARPDEACLQVITPGWRITLEANGREYVAHTDRLGENIR